MSDTGAEPPFSRGDWVTVNQCEDDRAFMVTDSVHQDGSWFCHLARLPTKYTDYKGYVLANRLKFWPRHSDHDHDTD